MPTEIRTLIVTTMRNEASYLLEWLAYHRAIGVTDFLIYTNDCDDGTDKMLEHISNQGWLAHEPNPRKGKKTVQWRALNRAKNHPKTKAADWIMVLDVDEYLVIKPGNGCLTDLFTAAPHASGFALSWRMFGSNGQISYEDRPLTERFTQAAPESLLWPWRAVQMKSLWRNNGTYGKLGVHRPRDPDPDRVKQFEWVDDRGRPIPGGPQRHVLVHDQPRYTLAQINHYALGSAQEFVIKQSRGRPNRSDMPIELDYWIERNFNAVEEHSISRHNTKIAQGMAEFLADPPLRRFHLEGVRWRFEQISKAMADLDSLQTALLLEQLGSTQVLPIDRQRQALRLVQHAVLAR